MPDHDHVEMRQSFRTLRAFRGTKQEWPHDQNRIAGEDLIGDGVQGIGKQPATREPWRKPGKAPTRRPPTISQANSSVREMASTSSATHIGRDTRYFSSAS
jgi:hypothetical protein